jgi:tetratricopeptide (TPR) repeat protein
MKTNYFDLQLRQNHRLMFFASILFVFSCSFQTAAQPGGCYSATWREEYCRKQREEILRQYASLIEDFSQKIAREPRKAEFYYQRGQVYSAIMFRAHLGFKNVEFDGKVYFADVDAKALADYTRAIKLAPKAEYYEARGDIYQAYWQREIPSFFYLNGTEKRAKEEILEIVERLFLENENFKAAEKDFQKAVRLSADYAASRNAREKLTALHAVRGGQLARNEYVADIIKNEKAADVALADHDYEIEHYRTVIANVKPSWVKNKQDSEMNSQFEKDGFYRLWLAKGSAAENFGRDSLALEAYNQAEKFWNKYTDNCYVYSYRAYHFLKRGDLEAALRDATFALESENTRCFGIAALRGDIYARKGDLRRAVEDYSAYLASERAKYDKETFTKRAKIYLKLGEAENAIADFTTVIGYYSSCEKDYRLRAEAYRLTGNETEARADEERAEKTVQNNKNYQPSDNCYYHEK